MNEYPPKWWKKGRTLGTQGFNLGACYSYSLVQQLCFYNSPKVDSWKQTQLLERRQLWFWYPHSSSEIDNGSNKVWDEVYKWVCNDGLTKKIKSINKIAKRNGYLTCLRKQTVLNHSSPHSSGILKKIEVHLYANSCIHDIPFWLSKQSRFFKEPHFFLHNFSDCMYLRGKENLFLW